MLTIEKIKTYLSAKEKKRQIEKKRERTLVLSKLKKLNIWQKYGLEKVYLYGGFANCKFHKYSDIDIAIEPDINFESLLKLYCEINKYFKREIDIRLLSELPFEEKIKTEGLIIYERKSSYSKK